MRYLDKKDLIEIIFPYVSTRYGRIEEVPDYENDREGMSQLLGVLERVQNDTYYPSVLDKTTYLITTINKGHFFANGNKRLALVITVAFLILNEKDLKLDSKEFYASLLSEIFPEEQEEWKDFPEFSSTDFATYNLLIEIAKSAEFGVDHDELKKRVYLFFKRIVTILKR